MILMALHEAGCSEASAGHGFGVAPEPIPASREVVQPALHPQHRGEGHLLHRSSPLHEADTGSTPTRGRPLDDAFSDLAVDRQSGLLDNFFFGLGDDPDAG